MAMLRSLSIGVGLVVVSCKRAVETPTTMLQVRSADSVSTDADAKAASITYQLHEEFTNCRPFGNNGHWLGRHSSPADCMATVLANSDTCEQGWFTMAVHNDNNCACQAVGTNCGDPARHQNPGWAVTNIYQIIDPSVSVSSDTGTSGTVIVESTPLTDYLTVGFGACRTIDGHRGDYSAVSAASAADCKVRCEGHGGCVAYEFTYQSKRCELHTTEISYAESSGNQMVECWVKTTVGSGSLLQKRQSIYHQLHEEFTNCRPFGNNGHWLGRHSSPAACMATVLANPDTCEQGWFTMAVHNDNNCACQAVGTNCGDPARHQNPGWAVTNIYQIIDPSVSVSSDTTSGTVIVESLPLTDYLTVGFGACRTITGHRGTYSAVSAASAADCKVRCEGHSGCVAYEFTYQSKRCELHTTEISYAESSGNQMVECWVKTTI